MIRKNVALPIMLLVIMMTMHVHADEVRTLRIDGIERSYLLHLPPGGTMSPHPLLLLFHGSGGRGKGMVKLTGIEPLADSEGFILAFPDGVRRHWHDGRVSKKTRTRLTMSAS